ncbi:MAG TPA: STAS domain-containing protein [Pyrinomonadaceae bacterium]|nr:STAS domain-containing protein [Pyrinomonadaceae bacterium]
MSRKRSTKDRQNQGEFAMLHVETKNLGTVSLLNLEGKVVVGETEVLHDTVHNLPPASSLILDLSNVTMMDAHGLGVMLQLREEAQARGMRIEFANVSEPLRQLLRITRLDTVFRIEPRVESFPVAA